jgi:hypothetical protein
MTRTLNSATATIMSSAPGPSIDGAAPRRKTASSGTAVFGVLISAALLFGYLYRDRLPNAEAGFGYYVGIIGAFGMLALLAYPLRKHASFMRAAGPVAWWFRTHMALGLIGPTLILYHSRFGLGSLNSNVALFSMLIVAGSGLVGRFIYAKIHRGLYGAKADLKLLAIEANEFRKVIADDIDPALSARFDAVEQRAFAGSRGMATAAAKAFAVTAAARSLHGQLRRNLKRALKKAPPGDASRMIRRHLDLCDRYFRRVEQAAELGFYDRLFSAWHILHLPLFILLILTAIVHVVAVHLY